MKPYTIIVLSAVAALSAGCATTAKLREKAPLIEASSAKSARVVAACITERWQGGGIFGTAMDVRSAILADGYSVSIMHGQTVQLLADVHDEGSGSVTKYYKPGFVQGTGKFEAAVKECQQ